MFDRRVTQGAVNFCLIILSSCFIYAFSFAEEGPQPAFAYTAEIVWNTDIPSTSQVEYGIKEGDYPDKSSPDENLVTSHKAQLHNLLPSTLYHYRVRSRDASGNEIISQDFTLMIAGKKAKAAIEISDVKASNIIAAGITSPAAAGSEAGEQKALSQAEKQPVQSADAQSSAGSMVAKEEPIEETLIERGGLLLSKNKLQIEPSYTYAHVSANKITVQGLAILPILVIGEISSEKVKRDIFIGALSSRYGILDNLQWNLKVPYRFQYERISNTASQEFTRSASGIGDIESGLFYQLCYEKGAMPGLIGGINVKSHTGKSPYGRDIGLGTGHWGIKPSLVWVKSVDPAILFGSFAYTWNIQRDINDFGKVDPGDTFEYSLGLAFALNYQAALNFQIEQQVTDRAKLNGTYVPGSFTNVANFKAGFTYSINKNLALDVVAGYGLTADAPDFTLEVRLPYTF